MWIGAIKLVVTTKGSENAGTDNDVVAHVQRNGAVICTLKLDFPLENDLEPSATREYVYNNLPLRNDQTPLRDHDREFHSSADDLEHPPFGLEFSRGLQGHFALLLQIRGDDMWVKDNVQLFIKEFRTGAGIGPHPWEQDADWTHTGNWQRDTAMSMDSAEGRPLARLFI